MYTTQQKAQCVHWYAQFASPTQVRRQFAREFKVYSRDAPSRKAIRDWHQKFVETGSLKDRCRSGRPGVSEEDIGKVKAAFRDDPSLSLRRASELLHMPKTTIHKILKSCEISLMLGKKSLINQDDGSGNAERSETMPINLKNMQDFPKSKKGNSKSLMTKEDTAEKRRKIDPSVIGQGSMEIFRIVSTEASKSPQNSSAFGSVASGSDDEGNKSRSELGRSGQYTSSDTVNKDRRSRKSKQKPRKLIESSSVESNKLGHKSGGTFRYKLTEEDIEELMSDYL